jgi:hypothetical protein
VVPLPDDDVAVVVNPANAKVVFSPETKVALSSAPGPPGPTGPQGPPGTPGGSRYQHFQAIPAAVWIVQHDLGYHPLFPTVVVDGEDATWAADIVYTDENNLTVGFSQPVTGEAAFQ